MATLHASRFVPAVIALTVAAVALAGCSGTGAGTGSGGSPTSSAASGPATAPAGIYAAPLPRPLVLAQGVSSANPAHLFRSQAWDFAAMRAVFDAVSLLPGDQATVQEARRAGLAVVLEFDDKKYFFAGEDISGKVQAIVDQVRSNPRTISAIDVADRLNQDYDPQQDLRYLAATAEVFHRELPGVPVLAGVSDGDLTCGLPGQAACGSYGPSYQFETNATLDTLKRSGYLDGFLLADNIQDNDVAAQVYAWQKARARWPSPFILWSTCSQLSFPNASLPAGPQTAAALVATYMTGPARGGAEGLALWAWHQLYQGSVYTFLNKDGSSNDVWRDMAAASASLGLAPAGGPAA
jgi:hypothetical protein